MTSDDAIYTRLGWAFKTAENSAEPTKVGCVIYDATGELVGVGWNVAPVPSGMSRDARRPYAVHAETLALVHAFNRRTTGEPLTGCTAYVTHHPCVACMAQLAVFGITRVIYALMPDNDRYDHADLAHAAHQVGITTIPVAWSQEDSP